MSPEGISRLVLKNKVQKSNQNNSFQMEFPVSRFFDIIFLEVIV
jgi:hypothetical protein